MPNRYGATKGDFTSENAREFTLRDTPNLSQRARRASDFNRVYEMCFAILPASAPAPLPIENEHADWTAGVILTCDTGSRFKSSRGSRELDSTGSLEAVLIHTH